MQYYLGIDIGKYHHQAILCDPEAKPVGPPLRFETTQEGFHTLFSYLKTHTQKEDFSVIHVGFEATGIYWLTLYEQLMKQNIRVSVLNPMQVKAYRNEGIRGAKTDRLDALLIVKVLRFGDYRESDIPDGDLFALRQLTRLRSDLVEMTSKIKLKIIGILDQVFPEYKKVFPDIFGNSSKALLQEALVPEAIAAIPTKKLAQLLRKASRGRYGVSKAENVKRAAEETIGIKLGIDAFSISLDILVTQIIHLEKQIERLNAEIEKRMAPRGETLTTIPGIGNVQEAAIIAEIGDFERFRNDKDGAEKLVAIAGIDPKVKESGKYKGQAKMSKRGSSYLRKTIRQSAFIASLGKGKDPMFTRIYEKKISEGKPFEVALSHVENKMLHVIYSLLKSKKEYVPN